MPFVKSLTGETLVCGPHVIHADRATRFEEVPEILLPLVDRQMISISEENPDVLRAEGIVITFPAPDGTGGAQNDGDTDPGGKDDKSPRVPGAPEGTGGAQTGGDTDPDRNPGDSTGAPEGSRESDPGGSVSAPETVAPGAGGTTEDAPPAGESTGEADTADTGADLAAESGPAGGDTVTTPDPDPFDDDVDTDADAEKAEGGPATPDGEATGKADPPSAPAAASNPPTAPAPAPGGGRRRTNT